MKPSGHDLRLNLAYSLYLIHQIFHRTKTPVRRVTKIKTTLSNFEKFNIYCPATDLAIGLKLAKYRTEKESYLETYSWNVNLSSKLITINSYKKHEAFWVKVRQAILTANPNHRKEPCYTAVESLAWIEDNQILTNAVDLASIYNEHYNIKPVKIAA